MLAATDIEKAARVVWAANAPLTAALPVTSVYKGNVPGGPAFPYGSMRARPLGEEWATEGRRYDRWELLVSMWHNIDTTLGDIVKLLVTAFDPAGWNVGAGATLVAVYAGGETFAEEPGADAGQVVWRCDVPFELHLDVTVP